MQLVVARQVNCVDIQTMLADGTLAAGLSGGAHRALTANVHKTDAVRTHASPHLCLTGRPALLLVVGIVRRGCCVVPEDVLLGQGSHVRIDLNLSSQFQLLAVVCGTNTTCQPRASSETRRQFAVARTLAGGPQIHTHAHDSPQKTNANARDTQRDGPPTRMTFMKSVPLCV